jgi:hypothetical protein
MATNVANFSEQFVVIPALGEAGATDAYAMYVAAGMANAHMKSAKVNLRVFAQVNGRAEGVNTKLTVAAHFFLINNQGLQPAKATDVYQFYGNHKDLGTLDQGDLVDKTHSLYLKTLRFTAAAATVAQSTVQQTGEYVDVSCNIDEVINQSLPCLGDLTTYTSSVNVLDGLVVILVASDYVNKDNRYPLGSQLSVKFVTE